jgi:trehalose 6-phosphate phosphatase
LKDILRPRHRPILEAFARSNVLLAFDFDGTLAKVVADPEKASMRPRTARLLGRVALLHPCVVISGRARADVGRRLKDVPIRAVVGNHGAEPWQGSRSLAWRVRRWKNLLAQRLAGARGVRIEDKVYSLAVHYRGAPDRAKARRAIAEAAAELAGARLVHGVCTVNVLGRKAPHKGEALERQRRRLGCEFAIYVGDDETDEDAFASSRRGRLLGIRVGASETSRAAYFLRSQRDVDSLLAILAAASRSLRGARRLPK